MKKNIKTWDELKENMVEEIIKNDKNGNLATEIIIGEKKKVKIRNLAFICSLVALIATNLWRIRKIKGAK